MGLCFRPRAQMKISALIFLLGFSVLVCICALQRGAGRGAHREEVRAGARHAGRRKGDTYKMNIKKYAVGGD